MAIYVIRCGRCSKEFYVGMLRLEKIPLQCMGIESDQQLYDYYRKKWEYIGGETAKIIRLSDFPDKCPYCNAEKTFFTEKRHII